MISSNSFIRTKVIDGVGMEKYMEQSHCDCNFECDCCVDLYKTDRAQTAQKNVEDGRHIRAQGVVITANYGDYATIELVEHIVDYRKNWSNGREMTRYENHERAALGLANRYEFEFDSMDGKTNSMNDGYHFKLK